MNWKLALVFLLMPVAALAQVNQEGKQPEKHENQETKPSNPHGLSESQWEHVQDNNVGRAQELAVGDVALSFDLPSLDETSRTQLAAFRGTRPVVLFFGSYT